MTDRRTAMFSQIRQIGILTTIPIILVVGPAIGAFFGSWVDRKMMWAPWGFYSGLVLGFAAVAVEIYQLLNEALRDLGEKKGSR